MSNQLAYVATVLSVVGILLFLKHTVDSSSGQLGTRRNGPQTAPAEDTFRNTQAVSRRDCKHELQPPHLQEGSAKSAKTGVDYVFTTAVGYTPYQTRAFLKTFRKHNQVARIIVLVTPNQVRGSPVSAHALLGLTPVWRAA